VRHYSVVKKMLMVRESGTLNGSWGCRGARCTCSGLNDVQGACQNGVAHEDKGVSVVTGRVCVEEHKYVFGDER